MDTKVTKDTKTTKMPGEARRIGSHGAFVILVSFVSFVLNWECAASREWKLEMRGGIV